MFLSNVGVPNCHTPASSSVFCASHTDNILLMNRKESKIQVRKQRGKVRMGNPILYSVAWSVPLQCRLLSLHFLFLLLLLLLFKYYFISFYLFILAGRSGAIPCGRELALQHNGSCTNKA